MIKIDKKEGQIALAGDAETLIDEIGVAITVLLDQSASIDVKMADKVASDLAVRFACAMKFVETERDHTINLEVPEKKKPKKTVRVKIEKEE